MFDVIYGVFSECAGLFNQMSPYLLFGFFVAGVLHVAFPIDAFARHLGKSGILSVMKAVIMGVPLPLCSCGVIPSAVLLRKRGASRGAVMSFLVATPITGVDSILATYSLMGFLFTIFRVVASAATAIVTGLLGNWLLPTEDAVEHIHIHHPTPGDPKCCHEEESKRKMTHVNRILEILRYAFVELLGDVWKWLVVGILIGGLISYFMPDAFVERHLGSGWLSMLIMLGVGIPMYVCATGSIPIAAALMLKGMSPGAAFVFLMAGPATNAVTFTVVSKELGQKASIIYVLSIAVMSVLMGVILDNIWPHMKVMMPSAVHHSQMLPYSLEVASSVVLFVLIAFSSLRGLAKRCKKDECCH